ncbi:hypothetical protein EDB19DRAFT_1384549 [Suillus lakei]|nr:hypothetical protein EDB19DRAFT_1384549 [Suillus lakei]
MKSGDFIGDYVGTILTADDIENLDPVTKYNGRNYFFEFSGDNTEEMLDAAPIGNSTRFLNHATERQANCVARSKSQHGATCTRQLNDIHSSSSCQWGASHRILHQ